MRRKAEAAQQGLSLSRSDSRHPPLPHLFFPVAKPRGCQVRGTDTRVWSLDPVGLCFSVAMGKKKQKNKNKIDQKQFWGKGFLWLLLLLPDYSPSWREAKAELKAETEVAVTRELQLASPGLLGRLPF